MKIIPLKTYANGEIYLKDNQLDINDKSGRMNNNLFKGLPIFFLILGVYQIFDAFATDNLLHLTVTLISALLLLAIPAMVYYPNLKRSNKTELKISEIKNVQLKKLFGELIIDFQLFDNSTRRVYNLKDLSDWELIKAYLIQNKISYLD
ncbi:hypothetical protein RM545_17115 [Zunongwangia sp. F260]|uniref:Uncharacterized protein n=1 Tax=Autumnicola lenta TaxID=3075593 RepID=A0ABU3CR44_9FLAO|nr:hypothetical protein [Zunongwangia sp. F260]MDT0648415.1 hypothetical protein [Zunongwangia sp. F260]